MSFGFGFGFTKITAAIRAAFSGVWYDPSDLSTLFQDSAGTTPVTAVEQPVGLMLDKSKGLALGPELVTNGDFSQGSTGWTAGPDWTVTGGEAVLSSTRVNRQIIQSCSFVSGKFYEVTFTVKTPPTNNARISVTDSVNSLYTSPANQAGTFTFRFLAVAGSKLISFRNVDANVTQTSIDNISVRELPGNHAYQTTATSRPVLSARVNQYLATETLATQNVTTLAAQYRLSFEGTGTITLSGAATGVYLAGSHLITCTAGTLTSTVSGSVTKADLRVVNDGANLPPYQRVNTATDYDTVGFPYYLRFDGVDDWLVTNTITPGIDKAQVFAGVRKMSNADSIVSEFSANLNTNAGTFYFASQPSGKFGSSSRGSAGAATLQEARVSGYFAPATVVISALHDIIGDLSSIRVNGIAGTNGTADKGTGNFGNYPLYIGRRGGTTLPFNGHLYSLIVRFGSNLPAATIEKTEKYINTKTRAY